MYYYGVTKELQKRVSSSFRARIFIALAGKSTTRNPGELFNHLVEYERFA